MSRINGPGETTVPQLTKQKIGPDKDIIAQVQGQVGGIRLLLQVVDV